MDCLGGPSASTRIWQGTKIFMGTDKLTHKQKAAVTQGRFQTLAHKLRTIQLKWLPKTLLQAQGFYYNKCKVWIPKPKATLSSSTPALEERKLQAHTPQRPRTYWQWKPKVSQLKHIQENRQLETAKSVQISQ